MILVSNCRKRWRQIQRIFFKIRKQIVESESSTHKKNSYYYLRHHLHFLNIYFEEKKITDINNIKYCCTADNKDLSPIQELTKKLTVHNFAELQTCKNTKRSFEEVDGDFSQKLNMRTKKIKIDKDIIVISDSENEDCNPIQKSLEESQKLKTDCDSDIKFLKSLVKYIKLMNHSQKRKLKRKFLKVIDKILDENCSENDFGSIWNMSSSPTSSTTKETDIYQTYVKNIVNPITSPSQTSLLLSTGLLNVNNVEEDQWSCNLSILNHVE